MFKRNVSKKTTTAFKTTRRKGIRKKTRTPKIDVYRDKIAFEVFCRIHVLVFFIYL